MFVACGWVVSGEGEMSVCVPSVPRPVSDLRLPVSGAGCAGTIVQVPDVLLTR